jgi:Lar family restriction alleviation protein
MTKILNCPFCGGSAQYEFDDTQIAPYGHYHTCNRCATTTGSYPSKSGAIEGWNRRAEASDKPIGEDAANGAIGEREAPREQTNTTALRAHAAKGFGDECLLPKASVKRIADELDSLRAALTAEKVTAEPVAYDMTYTNGNRSLVYPKELAHIEKARIVTGYVAAPLYAAAQPAQTQAALTGEQIWQSLKDIADSHTHPDDVVEAGRALLAAQPVSGGKS